MCSVTVRFHKDLDMAAVMVTEDYLAKHIRKRPLYAKIPNRPPRPESAFGPFPTDFKRGDYYDGNVHDRLTRIKPSKFPKAVFKGRSRAKTVFHELSNPSGSDTTLPTTGSALHSAIKNNVTGVLAAKIRGLPPPRRPATAHASTNNLQDAKGSAASRRGAAPSVKLSPSASGPTLPPTSTSSTKDLHVVNTQTTPVDTHTRPATQARPKSAPPSSSRMAASKVGVIRAVEGYMRHQGRFAVPPSQLLGEWADHKLRRGLRRITTPSRPPTAGAFSVRTLKATLFRQYYDRADLPISMLHRAGGNRLKWHVRPQDLDYHAYLPLFFDGLCEIDDPYRFMAIQGIIDLIEACPSKLLPCIPQVILPLKTALDTREPYIMCSAIKVLQHLLLADPQVGQALVPYYRQILPAFNLFKNKNENRGDGIDFNQRRRLCLGDLISETLELMELTGGPDAFINIKYMVPSYESSLVF